MREVRATVVDATGSVSNQKLRLNDSLGPDDVLLRSISSGICMSDVKLVESPDGFYPTVLGHEVLAWVVAVGPDVSSPQVGDLVLSTVSPICGACEFCNLGLGNLCQLGGSVVAGSQPDGRFRLADEFDNRVGQYCFLGSLADHFVTHSKQLHVIDRRFADVPEVAAISCSLSTAAGAVFARESRLAGKRIAVVGAGGLGTGVLLCLGLLDHNEVTVIDPDASRLASVAAINSNIEVNNVDSLRSDDRFDLVFEASAFGKGLPFSIGITRRGGECVAMGMPSFGTQSAFDHWGVVSEQKTVAGVVTTSATPWPIYDRLLAAHVSGKLDITSMIDKRYAFSDAPQALKEAGDHTAGKGLVLFN